MTSHYDKHGISFQYPENWHLSEERISARIYCITLQSPGSGFWMLQILPAGESPDQLVRETLQSVEQEYNEVEVTPRAEDLNGTPMSGFDLHFYYLDFLVCARIRSFDLADKSCVLLFQAEDDEFDKMAPVFVAITVSLLRAGDRQGG
jgi:hypothetical protein